MSSTEADRPDLASLARLEEAVARIVERTADLEQRLSEAETSRDELRSAVERFREGDADPVEVDRRAELVEQQNAELRERLETSRDAVQTMLARIRFLEENA